jgi:hypothetical protein
MNHIHQLLMLQINSFTCHKQVCIFQWNLMVQYLLLQSCEWIQALSYISVIYCRIKYSILMYCRVEAKCVLIENR